jgi:beta-lactamase class A
MQANSGRRSFLLHAIAATLVYGAGGAATRRAVAASPDIALAELAELEQRSGGRLGVFMLDTGDGRSLGQRADERFGLCSTFKLPLAAAILREADAGRLALDTVIPFTRADLVPHAPVTEAHLADGGMAIGALAEAAQLTSDNVAANLLMRRLGGPDRLTAILREMGDAHTRIDRYEPTMNLVTAGEPRDTTTPRAMAQLVARIMTGDVLAADSRTRLAEWMIATTTGSKRIRAGLPAGWRAGDKTGTAQAEGMPNKHNDVAIIWPPRHAPVLIAAYFEAAGSFDPMRAEDEAVLAEVGRIGARWILRGR